MLSSSSRRAAAASERAAGRSRAVVSPPPFLASSSSTACTAASTSADADRDHEVVRAGVLDREALVGEQLEVERGRHADRHLVAGRRRRGARDEHQRHRVVVGAAADDHVLGHAGTRVPACALDALAQPLERRDDRAAAAVGERERGAHLRPHAAAAELALVVQRAQPLRVDRAEPLLLGRAVTHGGGLDVGGDQERAGVHRARQQCAGEVLVEHRLDAAQRSVLAAPSGSRHRRRRPRSRRRRSARRSCRDRGSPAGRARRRHAASRARRDASQASPAAIRSCASAALT